MSVLNTTGQQLFNGSFEESGAPSLVGWEWTCADPGQPNEAAPGAGEWSATKETAKVKGCFPSYLFQRIPDAQNGTLITLSGWVRCNGTLPCVGAYIGLGRINSGGFTLEETVGSTASDWTFVSITDTIEFSDGDTAIVLLNSGIIGGPASPALGQFDGIELTTATAIPVVPLMEITQRMDRASGTLYLGTVRPFTGSMTLLDKTGRTVPAQVRFPSSTNAQVDIGALTPGTYFILVRTELGERTVRFTTW